MNDCYQNDDAAYSDAMSYFDGEAGIPEGYYQDDDAAHAAAMAYFNDEED